jgi:hypothetical protein
MKAFQGVSQEGLSQGGSFSEDLFSVTGHSMEQWDGGPKRERPFPGPHAGNGSKDSKWWFSACGLILS